MDTAGKKKLKQEICNLISDSGVSFSVAFLAIQELMYDFGFKEKNFLDSVDAQKVLSTSNDDFRDRDACHTHGEDH